MKKVWVIGSWGQITSNKEKTLFNHVPLECFIAGNPRYNQRWPQKYKKGPTPLSFGCHETSDPRPQKLRPRNLSLLERSKEKRFKLVAILSPKMFYGHAMFIWGNSQKGSRYLLSLVYHCCICWIQNWLQVEQHYRLWLSVSISLVKNLPANAIKIAGCNFKPCFSWIDQCYSAKLKKANISLLSGRCLCTLHDHKTFKVIRTETTLNLFLLISRGLSLQDLSFFEVWGLSFHDIPFFLHNCRLNAGIGF